MQKTKILIVEDEVLIADTITRYLESRGYEIVGNAISYDQALSQLQTHETDLVLIDIRLRGKKTGIDVAKYINENDTKIPFLFLTSQTDEATLKEAKATFPEGYLSKPIQKHSLYSMIEIILHKQLLQVKESEGSIIIKDNEFNHHVDFKDIMYVSADHVYLNLHLKSDKVIVTRQSLKWIIEQLPTTNFMQVHRSFVVNINHVAEWNNNVIIVSDKEIPISRGRKKKTLSTLEDFSKS